MSSKLTFYAILGFYLILMLLIGLLSNRKNRSRADFFVMSGTAGFFITALSYFATQSSMSTFMGAPAEIFNNGQSAFSHSFATAVFSFIIPALLVGFPLYELSQARHYLTISEFLGERYSSKSVQVAYGIAKIIFTFPVIVAQLIGIGLIFKIFSGQSVTFGIVLMGLVVTLYSFLGGMRSAVWTDVIQGLLMVLIAFFAFFGTLKVGGGLHNIIAKVASLNPRYLTFPGIHHKYTPLYNLSVMLLWSFLIIGQPFITNKFLLIKSKKSLYSMISLGTATVFITTILVQLSGFNMIAILPHLKGSSSEYIIPEFAKLFFPPWLSALLITGVLSAGLSTISGIMIVISSAFTEDILAMRKQGAALSPAWPKAFVFIIGVAMTAVAMLRPSSIFKLVIFSYGGMGIWTVPILFAIYSKTKNRWTALIPVAFGTVSYVTFQIVHFAPLGISPVLLGALVTLVLQTISTICWKWFKV